MDLLNIYFGNVSGYVQLIVQDPTNYLMCYLVFFFMCSRRDICSRK